MIGLRLCIDGETGMYVQIKWTGVYICRERHGDVLITLKLLKWGFNKMAIGSILFDWVLSFHTVSI